jgi:predicted transglutaminase-like cysteine proteinase
MAKRFLSHRLLGLAGAASAAASASAAAQAQTAYRAAPTAPNWAKSEAILGGAPSALEAILAQQNGRPAPVRAQLRPASFSIPQAVPAVVRQGGDAAAGARSGRPDVFGSVALPVRETSLDARWRTVERARLGGARARFAQSLRSLAAVERLETVNRYVNDQVRFVEDHRQHGRADVWSAAADTLKRGRGDCEDYAIAKLQMLRRAGFADRDLYLVIVKDLVSRSDHAVLVARAAGRLYVLDNGTDRLLESESVRDYRPILTFSAGAAWTHGYRLRSAPVNIASAEIKDSAPLAPAASNQRSRSASLLAFNTGLSK